MSNETQKGLYDLKRRILFHLQSDNRDISIRLRTQWADHSRGHSRAFKSIQDHSRGAGFNESDFEPKTIALVFFVLNDSPSSLQ